MVQELSTPPNVDFENIGSCYSPPPYVTIEGFVNFVCKILPTCFSKHVDHLRRQKWLVAIFSTYFSIFTWTTTYHCQFDEMYEKSAAKLYIIIHINFNSWHINMQIVMKSYPITFLLILWINIIIWDFHKFIFHDN